VSLFDVAVILVAALAGAVAALTGFGVGSLLTPLLATQFGTKTAVALVSVPHLVATAVRFYSLRGHVDKRVFWSFGILSAIGGFAGAMLNAQAGSRALAGVLGGLLVFAGLSGLTGIMARMRLGRVSGAIAGALSGFFGGLVGNQGGIRSAALMGFDISRDSLIATATAVALVVDGARMPVYFATQAGDFPPNWPIITVATIGVLAGTFWGVKLLQRIPERTFRPLLSVAILALGGYMLFRALA
jgi:uncharacterized protein